MSNVSINTSNLREKIAPLYHRYQSQSEAQDAYVEMTENGTVSADWDGEISGTPADVWHNRTLRWSVPSTVRGDELADLLERADVIALLERVYLGHTVEWDGNNHVGHLDDDADEASGELARIFERELNTSNDGAGVWDAREWMDGVGLLGNWSGKPLDEAVSEVEAGAESEGVHLDGDVEDELLDWAESYVDSDRAGLDAHHLRALLNDGRIDAETAAEYADDHGIEFTA
ncbi:MAG: hypothetical protein AB1450_08400 [Pseudomonadota bacterium]